MTSDDQSSDLERKRLDDWRVIEARICRELAERLAGEHLKEEMQRLKERWYRHRLIQEDVARGLAQKAELIAKIQPVLDRIDPVGYSRYPGHDPKVLLYRKEAALIALRLDEARRLKDLECIVKEAFVRVQAPLSVQSPGYLARYAEITTGIWTIMGKDDKT